jgi:hypothetical protein
MHYAFLLPTGYIGVMLPVPTPAVVKAECDAFDQENELTEKALRKLRTKFPLNTDEAEVLLKALVLNKLYSTRVNDVDIPPLAHHIAGLNIDPLLDKGSLDAVNQIMNCPGLDKEYSFATKFCSWHNPTAYPIYDGNAEACVWAYQKQDKFGKFRRQDLRRYEVWVETVKAFRTHYGLGRLPFRELDKFLWRQGALLKGVITSTD